MAKICFCIGADKCGDEKCRLVKEYKETQKHPVINISDELIRPRKMCSNMGTGMI